MKTFTSILLATLFGVSLLRAQEDGLKGAKSPGPVKADEFNDRPKVAPKRGGEITEAVPTGFRSLDAYQDTSALTSEIVHQYVEEGLVDSDVETWGNTPKLAESWDMEDNAALRDCSVELKDKKVRGRVISENDTEAEIKTDSGTLKVKKEETKILSDLVRGKVTETPEGCTVKTSEGKVVNVKKDDLREIRYQTSFTFHLRKGVKFHNGDDFSAADVSFSYKLYHDPRNGMPSIQSYFDKIVECTVIDDFTVRMTYIEQYWMALNVCGGYLYIRPHKAWDPNGDIDKNPDAYFKKLNEHPLMLHPIGTGPYQFDSYKKDFEVVIKRFDDWWGAKGLKAPDNGQWPDKLRYRIIKDNVAQLQALKNGEVDYVTAVTPELFDDFFKDADNKKNFAEVTIIYPTYGYMGFNIRREMWKDKRVRKALAMGSVDNDKFIKEVLKGRAERVAGDYYKYCDSYNSKLKPLPFDQDKAAELLAEAGWFDSEGDGILRKDGKKFEFELLVRELPPNSPAMQHILLMQSNLKKLGIKMEIRKLEWGAFLEKVEKGDYDVCRLGWAMSSPPDQQDCYQIWHSSQIGEAGSNHVAYANPQVDRLLVAIRRELDAKKRHEMEHKVQEILFEDQPYNWLYMPAEHRIYNKKWRGVRFWVPRPCHSLNEWYLGD